MDLIKSQWEAIRPHLPASEMKEDPRRGRPYRDPEDVLNGILWVLRTGAPWKDLPPRYPPYQTCHRRFQQWIKAGVLARILRALAEDLLKRGKIDLAECYIDGTFASAKKGALRLVRQSAARAPRSWQSQTAMVFLSPSGLKALARMK